jgi:hypothetical protein
VNARAAPGHSVAAETRATARANNSCQVDDLAKNAGTSVDQIERFYARNLPLSKEMAINLQSFGSES